MSQDWPSPRRPDRPPLPTIDDLPLAPEGYDRESVDDAFTAFYRHIAQLDATLRTLEAVESFRLQAGELRADLRSIRAAGWSPYPRGYAAPPGAGLGLGIPEAVPRLALEVAFLITVAVVLAVGRFSSAAIVAAMAVAVAITALVEWVASRGRRPATALPPPPAVPAAPAFVVDAAEALAVMGASSEPAPEPPAAETTEEFPEPGPEPEPESEREVEPSLERDLDPWERGFDIDFDEADVDEDEAPLRR